MTQYTDKNSGINSQYRAICFSCWWKQIYLTFYTEKSNGGFQIQEFNFGEVLSLKFSLYKAATEIWK
jgi:hypothetical protein